MAIVDVIFGMDGVVVVQDSAYEQQRSFYCMIWSLSFEESVASLEAILGNVSIIIDAIMVLGMDGVGARLVGLR